MRPGLHTTWFKPAALGFPDLVDPNLIGVVSMVPLEPRPSQPTPHAENHEPHASHCPVGFQPGHGYHALAQDSASCAPALFNNGRFVTATTGAGPAGTDAISTIPAGGTFGSNSNDAYGFQLAEDFIVPPPGWNIGALTFSRLRLLATGWEQYRRRSGTRTLRSKRIVGMPGRRSDRQLRVAWRAGLPEFLPANP